MGIAAEIKDISIKADAIDSFYKFNDKYFFISRNFNIGLRKPFQWLLKRFIDIVGSMVGIILLLPLFIAVSVAIKLESKGPIFFKQKRSGLYGNDFYIYKFRSMRQDAEAKLNELIDSNQTNNVMFKVFEDPRATRIGKIIRKFSIDELPQLFNVIKGDMSLVGPRPPLKREIQLYEPWHYVRFSTLPGITGMWQVNGRAEITDFNKVVIYDWEYISEWDLLLDLKILLKTIPVVISTKGAG